MKLRVFLYALITVSLAATGGFFYAFQTPDSLDIVSIAKPDSKTIFKLTHTVPAACIMQSGRSPIDRNGRLNVLVWNIYKQQNTSWTTYLNNYSEDRQLLLLQENRLDTKFENWLRVRQFSAAQVSAFTMFGDTTGVTTLAQENSALSCAATEMEPNIRLNKSSLMSYFPLSNGETLVVVNLHMVNFTWGTEAYQHQLKMVTQQVYDHDGPMIIAGDFNSWSKKREAILHDFVTSLSLREVAYTPDNRKRFFYNDNPIDHLFYRGLNFQRANVSLTDASDHNPILATFFIN